MARVRHTAGLPLKRYLEQLWPSQWALIALMTAITAAMALLGGYALRAAPALLVDSDIVTAREGIEITRIGEVSLDPTDLWRLPAFSSPATEAAWWRDQKRLYESVANKNSVIIRFTDNTDTTWEVSADVGRMSLAQIAARIGLVYVVVAVYVVASISVFRHHKNLTGFLCAFFLSSTALYLVSVASVVHRPILMDPGLLRILIAVFFVASTGQISMVHFALIFPRRKRLLDRFPVIPALLYGYAAVISALYLSGTIALATTLPFLVVWLVVMLGSFVHSMVSLEDEFMGKQVRITFMAVLLVAAFFILSILLPWPEGENLVNNYALFSLMLPFGLILSLDNQRLYRDRIELEANARTEKERLHRELHDTVLNDLASIAIAVEGAEQCSSDAERLRLKLEQIRNSTAESSRQLRNFLWVIDDRQNTWEDIANSLRRLGYDLLGHLDVTFDLASDIRGTQAVAPTPALKHTIYKVFREALINIGKHAAATRVESTLSVDDNRLEISVADDGVGMSPPGGGEPQGHGLKNMLRRVREQGGALAIHSVPGSGTRLVMQLPFRHGRGSVEADSTASAAPEGFAPPLVSPK
jgi:signal transduction histidine kinase